MFRGKRSGDFEHVFLFQELVDVEYSFSQNCTHFWGNESGSTGQEMSMI